MPFANYLEQADSQFGYGADIALPYHTTTLAVCMSLERQ